MKADVVPLWLAHRTWVSVVPEAVAVNLEAPAGAGTHELVAREERGRLLLFFLVVPRLLLLMLPLIDLIDLVLLTASRGMFRLVTLPAEPAARDVHGTTGVRVDRPVVETPRGLDPVTLVHSNSGADFAGDSVAPSVVAVAEASARNVDAGRRVRIELVH